jgi:hypothetical protein
MITADASRGRMTRDAQTRDSDLQHSIVEGTWGWDPQNPYLIEEARERQSKPPLSLRCEHMAENHGQPEMKKTDGLFTLRFYSWDNRLHSTSRSNPAPFRKFLLVAACQYPMQSS